MFDKATHQPLSGVHVRVEFDGPDLPPVLYGALTNSTGRFSIKSIAAGTYSVSVERAGFIYLGPPTVTLKAGEQAADLRLELTTEAVISGRVLDENGDPVPSMVVELLPAPTTDHAASGVSDDRGEFRIRCAPGKYRLRVDPGFSAGNSLYAPSEENQTVESVAAHELTGNDVHLVRQRILTLSGTVSGMSHDEPTIVFARPVEGSGIFGGAMVAREGKFTVPRLASGRTYRLTAQCPVSHLRSRSVEVTLDDRDVTGVELTMMAGAEVTGNLEIVGDRTAFTVLLYPAAAVDDTLRRCLGGVDNDGGFRIPDVFPGKYLVRVEPLTGNDYVKEVRVDGAVVDGTVDFSAGAAGSHLKVTVSHDGGQITGDLTDEDGARLTNTTAIVFLISGDSKNRYTALVNPDGSYLIGGIRPGKYRLFALAGLPGQGQENKIPEGAWEVSMVEGARLTKDVALGGRDETHGP